MKIGKIFFVVGQVAEWIIGVVAGDAAVAGQFVENVDAVVPDRAYTSGIVNQDDDQSGI